MISFSVNSSFFFSAVMGPRVCEMKPNGAVLQISVEHFVPFDTQAASDAAMEAAVVARLAIFLCVSVTLFGFLSEFFFCAAALTVVLPSFVLSFGSLFRFCWDGVGVSSLLMQQVPWKLS